MEIEDLAQLLADHEAASQKRYEHLCNYLKSSKGTDMHETPVIENIFRPGSAGFAGVDGLGFGGGGALGLIALLALLGGRGNWGGHDGGADTALVAGMGAANANMTIMDKLGQIQAQVPLSACETQGVVSTSAAATQQQILTQAMALMNQIGQGQLLTSQGFAQTGDKIDALSAASALGFGQVNTGIERVGWQLSKAICEDGDKTRSLITSNEFTTLQRQLGVAEAALAEERGSRRIRDVEVSVNQTVTQNQTQLQQQQQQQQQFAQLFGLIHGLAGQIQLNRQAQDIVNLGTMTGSATQGATSTQVR